MPNWLKERIPPKNPNDTKDFNDQLTFFGINLPFSRKCLALIRA